MRINGVFQIEIQSIGKISFHTIITITGLVLSRDSELLKLVQ